MFINHLRLVQTFCLTASLFCFILPLVSSDEWSYRDQNHWPKECSGNRQSPIDIETKLVSVNNSLSIERKNYNISFTSFNIINNGHTVQLSLRLNSDQERPYITGIALENKKYIFEQLHFHWSGERGRGSEHAINGRLHSMEMHLVHYNQEYGSLDNAKNKVEDGLAVIGVFFNITRKNNMHLDPIIDGVKNVKIEGTQSLRNDKSINLDDLLPDNLDLFYRYKGSLTTPPCTESVTWLLYSDINDIGIKQIQAFRDLLNSKKDLLSDTFRNLQNSRDRKIESSQIVGGKGTHIQSNLFIVYLSLTTSLLIVTKQYL